MKRRNSTKLVWAFILFYTQCAFALHPGDHEAVTVRALNQTARQSFINDQQFRFTESAIRDIAKDNKTTDLRTAAGEIFPSYHCDQNLLPKCAERITKNIAAIIESLAAADSNRPTDLLIAGMSARSVFGSTLHTIQDFYAHSTWLDVYPVTAPTFSGSDPFSSSPIGCSHGDQLIDLSQYVVSEFFALTDDGNLENAREGRCIHGPCPFNFGSKCGSEPRIQGIAKDDEKHPLHEAALIQSEIATAYYAGYILDSLETRGKYQAICAFTGQNPSSCVKRLDVAVPEIDFSNFTVDTDYGFGGQFNLSGQKVISIPLFDRKLGKLLWVEKKFHFVTTGAGSCTLYVFTNPNVEAGCGFGYNSLELNGGSFLFCSSDPADAFDAAPSCLTSIVPPHSDPVFRAASSFSVSDSVESDVLVERINSYNADYYQSSRDGSVKTFDLTVGIDGHLEFASAIKDSSGWYMSPNHGAATFNGQLRVVVVVTYFYVPYPAN